ncbi:hypothetical protein [Planctomicrobium sp. SH664]|uniref:hypothetical protein n=1 Tax=Planctomicrobium sp. SH664 TaxID=3448125 RepID=UPI003F5C0682
MSHSIGFWHFRTGEELTLELYPVTGGGIANGVGGAALTEPDPTASPGFYQAEVEETLHGNYHVRVRLNAQPIYAGLVYLTTEVGMAVIDAAPVPPMTVSAFESSALTQLAARRNITIAVPTLAGQSLSAPLIQGDSYLAEHGRAIEFSRSDFPDLSGDEQVTLTASSVDTPAVTFTLEGSIAVATGAKVLRFEPTSIQTRLYPAGRYEFDVEVEFADGNRATFVGPNVFLRVLADVTDN